MASGRASRPQTWNRYSYVLNNPLRLIDPDGLKDREIIDEEGAQCPECEEPVEPPQNTVLVKSATIKVGNDTIQGETSAFGITFNLDKAQTAEVFGAQSFQVNVNLLLPAEVATMTPTTSKDVIAPTQRGIDKAAETEQPAKDSQTMISGSQVRLPENSNLSTTTGKPELTPGGKANRRPLESGVTFSDVITAPDGKLKMSTASVSLRARSDSVNGSNTFSLRLQGASEKGQVLRYQPIQITIRPSKE